jgi:Tol biopolymer transport system component
LPGPKTPAAATGGSSGGGGAGSLIITLPEGLSEYSIKDGTSKPLIKPANDSTFLLDPALSADGKLLAYVVQPPPKVQGTKYDAGSDLWVAKRDGSGQHAVFTHDTPNQLVRFPQWEDAGHMLAIVMEIENAGGTTNVTYVLERIDVATGERARLLNDVLAFGLAPDGKHAVYAKLSPQTGETLNTIEIGGGPEATLVGIDQNLSPFNSPRYSPDGTKIAFASADQTGARAHMEYVTAAGFGRDAAPALDGLPEDIWTIAASGGAPQRVADLKEDLPALTWGADGKHIYVVGAAGLYDVNLENGKSTRIGEGSFHGQIIWAP